MGTREIQRVVSEENSMKIEQMTREILTACHGAKNENIMMAFASAIAVIQHAAEKAGYSLTKHDLLEMLAGFAENCTVCGNPH
jgi:hypothetical protein